VRSAIVVAFALVLLHAARARADEDATRLADRCKAEPDGPLCREVRRACALRSVRPEVVPACQALGWWGDSTRAKVENLCPVEPDHPDCQAMRAACEHGRRVADDQDAICHAMGWVALDDVPGEPEADADDGAGNIEDQTLDHDRAVQVVRFCKGHPDTDACKTLIESCKHVDASDREDVRFTCGELASSDTAPQGGNAVAATPDVAASAPTAHAGVGLVTVDLRAGLLRDAGVDPAASLRSTQSYGLYVQAARLGFRGRPAGGVVEFELGATGAGDVAWRGRTLLGVGAWVLPRACLALEAGAGVGGVSGRIPARAELPVRAQAFAYVGERVTLSGWAGVGWTFALEDGAAPPSALSFADVLEGGAVVLFGGRTRGTVGVAGWSLGGVVRESDGITSVSLLLGFGQVSNPFRQGER
jgi:hypothetical protein